jgi:hypothetical protein
MICKDGICLIRRKNEPKICKNYEVCYNYIEEHDLYYGLCLDCHNLFGKWRNNLSEGLLKTIQNNSCHICNNILKKISVFRPNCKNKHYLCVDCFRLLYYGYRLDSPVFPYKIKDNKEYEEYITKEYGTDNEDEEDDDKDFLLVKYCKLKKHYILFKKIHDYLLYNSSCFECNSEEI